MIKLLRSKSTRTMLTKNLKRVDSKLSKLDKKIASVSFDLDSLRITDPLNKSVPKLQSELDILLKDKSGLMKSHALISEQLSALGLADTEKAKLDARNKADVKALQTAIQECVMLGKLLDFYTQGITLARKSIVEYRRSTVLLMSNPLLNAASMTLGSRFETDMGSPEAWYITTLAGAKGEATSQKLHLEEQLKTLQKSIKKAK